MVKRYGHHFTVEGRGQFPVDMLRYDSCWPADSADAGRIMASIENRRRERWTINLLSLREKKWEPTERRWMSFNWTVTDHHVYPID